MSFTEGWRLPKPKPIKKAWIYMLVFLVVLVVLCGLIYKTQQAKQTEKQKTVAEIHRKGANKKLLQSRNYVQYQLELTDYANSYTDKGQYEQTERVLGQVLKDVPRKDITSETYRSYWYLYYTKKDSANRKKYALLTAEKLKQEGEPQQAAQFEKDAKRD